MTLTAVYNTLREVPGARCSVPHVLLVSFIGRGVSMGLEVAEQGLFLLPCNVIQYNTYNRTPNPAPTECSRRYSNRYSDFAHGPYLFIYLSISTLSGTDWKLSGLRLVP